jgi:hypothetical protein
LISALAVLLSNAGVWAQTAPAASDATPEQAKAEADIRQAVRQIQELSEDRPERALARLKQLQDRLDADAVLSQERRAALKRMVTDRIRVTEAEIERRAVNDAVRSERRADDEQRVREQSITRRLLDGLKKLQQDGKGTDAGRAADDPARRLSASPAVQAARRINEVADQLARNRQLQRDRERGAAEVVRSVERSARPPSGDVEFPADWKEKTQIRTKTTAVRTTPTERAILRALDTPISVDFQGSPLETALEYLRTLTGQPIIVNREALEAAGVSYESQVTFRIKGATLRTVLRKILGDVGLTYVVKDEVIQVVTPLEARNLMVTRVHYIGDLITAPDEFGAAWQAGQIIKLIQSVVEPGSWAANGGPGTIAYDPLTRSLVIKQSAEFHGTLGSSLP